MAFLRFFFAALILFPFALNQLHIQKKDIFNIALMALFGVSLSIGLFLLALTSTDSINAPLIGSSAPIFVIIISMFFFHEQAKVRTIAGSVLGLLGIVVILLNPILEKGLDSSLIGNLLLVASTITGVIHLFISKKLRKTYSPITLTFYSFLFGSLFFIPLFVSDVTTRGMPTISIQGFIGIAFGAVIASAMAHFFFYWSEKYLNSADVAIFAYIPPVVAVLVAIPLLHEKVSELFLIGALLVFVGLYIAEANKKYHPLHHNR